jgi:hypothetical protein
MIKTSPTSKSYFQLWTWCVSVISPMSSSARSLYLHLNLDSVSLVTTRWTALYYLFPSTRWQYINISLIANHRAATVPVPHETVFPPITYSLWTFWIWDYSYVLSDERMGLSFTIAAGPRQLIHSRVWFPWDWLATIFYCLRFETSFLSPPTTRRGRYSTPPPHGKVQCERERVTLRLAAYRQSVRLGAWPLETHDQRFFFQLNSCGNSPYVTSSLTRRWVCLLWICLAFRQVCISHIV